MGIYFGDQYQQLVNSMAAGKENLTSVKSPITQWYKDKSFSCEQAEAPHSARWYIVQKQVPRKVPVIHKTGKYPKQIIPC